MNLEELESLQARLVKNRVSFLQLVVLKIIEQAPTAMRDLTKRLMTTSAGATSFIDTMESRGLVSRSHDPKDRRLVIITPTPKGAELTATLTGNILEKIHQKLIEDGR